MDHILIGGLEHEKILSEWLENLSTSSSALSPGRYFQIHPRPGTLTFRRTVLHGV